MKAILILLLIVISAAAVDLTVKLRRIQAELAETQSEVESFRRAEKEASKATTAKEAAATKASIQARLKIWQTKSDTLDANERTARARLAAMEASPPLFREQRIDEFGRYTGIRTSETDRKKAMDLYQTEVSNLQQYLNSIEAARSQLIAERNEILYGQ